MDAKHHQLHIILFPFPAPGHMIPLLNIARLFASRNVKVTIITTPVNASSFTKAIEMNHKTGNQHINLEIFKFPAQEAGLPEGCENADIAIKLGLSHKFMQSTQLLSEQLEQFLDKVRPDCLVADMFFPWTSETANKSDVPRVVFLGISYFALCAQELIRVYKPFENLASDDATFSIPLIPHEIKLFRSQVHPDLISNKEDAFRKIFDYQIKKSEDEIYGVIVNSFYELEPDYADFFKKEQGRKAWHVGPVSLCNRSIEEKAQRGKETSINDRACLTWLDLKKPASVVYICFGSVAPFIAPQQHEISMALESSGKNFIWVVRSAENGEEWLPPGFEQRTQGKGLIIRGWAPQVLILEHKAIGAFVTHCGWNSTLEGITAGVPMVTWPIFAEQFYNEKLVTHILKTGVSVGVKKWSISPSVEDLISREAIETTLRNITEGDEAEEMKQRAKQLKDMAWKSVAEGGSSYSGLTAFIDDLRDYRTQNRA
ncbi:scopoletin glucosyltransferase-like [Silene latifolia]|uniref:scopoletin glucosyltransferase-like n=1 Tax=Silene latifolia TaxID=37657 RepID=UPI003D782E2E